MIKDSKVLNNFYDKLTCSNYDFNRWSILSAKSLGFIFSS